jgi:hypothetical protein
MYEDAVILAASLVARSAQKLPNEDFVIIKAEYTELLGEALCNMGEEEEERCGKKLSTAEVMLHRIQMNDAQIAREHLIDMCDRLYLAVFDEFPNPDSPNIHFITGKRESGEYRFIDPIAIANFLEAFRDCKLGEPK